MALAWQESGWQRNKVSSTRAVGVMQLMPDTVEFVSVQLLGTKPLDPRDPIANIRMGTRFLRYLLDSNGGTSTGHWPPTTRGSGRSGSAACCRRPNGSSPT